MMIRTPRRPRLQAKEDRARPAGPGDRPGDLGQRAIARLLPDKAVIADQDLMGMPLPFPYEPRTGLEPGNDSQSRLAAPAGLLGDVAQPALRFGSEPAQRLFLQAVGDGANQQLAA